MDISTCISAPISMTVPIGITGGLCLNMCVTRRRVDRTSRGHHNFIRFFEFISGIRYERFESMESDETYESNRMTW
jgi:hypothetical protein